MSNDLILLKLEKCNAMLAECKTAQQAKGLIALSDAAKAYAKQVGASTRCVNSAVEVKLRAERILGEILSSSPKAKGGTPYKKKPTGTATLPVETLADAKVTKNASSQAQKLARIPSATFEKRLVELRKTPDGNEIELTTKAVLTGKAHVSNASGNHEWYTPHEYIEAARAVLGEIDCDPASSRAANKIVKAKEFYSAVCDGLTQRWGKRVWMNPPYGQPLITKFCALLVKRLQSKDVDEALVLVNNATETEWFQSMVAVASHICLIKGRIKFLDETGSPVNTPLQGQVVLYFGSCASSFKKHFSKFGIICEVTA